MCQQRLRQKHQVKLQADRERAETYHHLEAEHIRIKYTNEIEKFKVQLLKSIRDSEDGAADTRETYLRQLKDLIQTLDSKQEQELQASAKRVGAQLQEEAAKLEAKKH